jgi:3-hydroxyisobutyrate dehydrogenase
VWNRTPSKAKDLGIPVATSPKDLFGRVDIVIINLFDSDAVDSVLSGPERVFSGSFAGKIIVDTTTNHFGRLSEFYARAREHGATYLECPLLGSVVPASQGKLTILRPPPLNTDEHPGIMGSMVHDRAGPRTCTVRHCFP